ncbi:orotidine-5'-phosphate decarboxylase [Nocardioidaceae bacterium]|nr:orotidine-5'-phosphate decarboxylase [Nocardioidaceae bacterium]
MDARGPLCVGIDPHAALLDAWGLHDDVGGLETFASTCVEALAPHAAVIKPQSAFFERFGAAGVAVLERTIRDSQQAGALVLLDVKRGDIGSTAQAYAEAFLHPDAAAPVDAVTVSPYLGFGSVRPFLDVAHAHGRGVFVLALTSNPEAPSVQHARTSDGLTVAGGVLAGVAAENADRYADAALGSVGAVVGATVGKTDEDLDIGGPLLAPGFGAQGGTVEDLRRIFAGVTGRVVPTSSREILTAGPSVVSLTERFQQVAASVRGLGE